MKHQIFSRWDSAKVLFECDVPDGIESGLRYTRHSPPLRALIIRNVCFSVCASALWAPKCSTASRPASKSSKSSMMC